MAAPRYTCPCCGYLTLDDWPGSYDICSVCYWEDDPVQLLDPWSAGGANVPALFEAQENYVTLGAMEERFVEHVRGLLPSDRRDEHWRRANESDRSFVRTPASLSSAEHQSLQTWYYWRRDAA